MREKLPRLYRVRIESSVIVLANSAKEAEEQAREGLVEMDPDVGAVTAYQTSRNDLRKPELSYKPYVVCDLDPVKNQSVEQWLIEIEAEEKEMKAEVEFQKKQIPLPFNRYLGMAVEEILDARGWDDVEHIKLLEGFLYSRELYGEFRRYLIARAHEEELDSGHEEELG
jgi:hypothetical protein